MAYHHHPHCPHTVVHPTQYCVNDYYSPQIVQHIHPLETINRFNTVYVPQHVYPHRERNVPGNVYYTGY